MEYMNDVVLDLERRGAIQLIPIGHNLCLVELCSICVSVMVSHPAESL